MTKLIDVFTVQSPAVKAEVSYVYIPTLYYLVTNCTPYAVLYHTVSCTFWQFCKKWHRYSFNVSVTGEL